MVIFSYLQTWDGWPRVEFRGGREGGKRGIRELLACVFCVDGRKGPAHASRDDDKLLLYLFELERLRTSGEIDTQEEAYVHKRKKITRQHSKD